MLNLSLLAETHRPVVHCREKWQAEMLIREFNELLPGKVYMNSMSWWSVYKNETCYYTDIRVMNGNLKSVRFEYCNKSWYQNSGYTPLEFDEVVFGTVDFGELHTDGADINNLFYTG